MKTASIATYRFSTQAPPDYGQLAALRTAFGRGFVRVDFESLPTGHFSFDATLRLLPGLSILSGVSSGAIVRRTGARIADGAHDIVLCVALDGPASLSRPGWEQTLSPGEGVLLSCSGEWTLALPGCVRFLGVRAPRQALRALTPDVEGALFRPIPRDAEALRFLQEYLALLDQTGMLSGSDSDLEVGRLFATHVHNLMALAAASIQRDAAPVPAQRTPGALLAAIENDIASHLEQADLSISDVAARHGVSPRHIQRLFQAKGTTFSKYLIAQRLATAYGKLTDPSCAGAAISDIAFDAGFGDLSYFNRVFRRLYGATPSKVRASKGGGQ